MIVAIGSTTIDLTTNSGTSTAPITCETMLEAAKGYNYNAVLAIPAFNNQVYLCCFINIIVEDETVYFTSHSSWGQKKFDAYASDFDDHYGYADNGTVVKWTQSSIRIENTTYDSRTYKGINWGNESKEVYFYTDLPFSHCKFQDQDVPVPVQSYTSNGGGATHIAKVTGQLKDLSSNLSDILMVSGGGGGGMLVGETEYAGADAGGISGSGDNSADQSTGYAFGRGESGTNVSGGGSGLYGGYKGALP